jgi:hypothetical protein
LKSAVAAVVYLRTVRCRSHDFEGKRVALR